MKKLYMYTYIKLNFIGIVQKKRLIQEKSLGNPGYIESYLFTLLQFSGLNLVDMSIEQMYELGFVLPPLEFLKMCLCF